MITPNQHTRLPAARGGRQQYYPDTCYGEMTHYGLCRQVRADTELTVVMWNLLTNQRKG